MYRLLGWLSIIVVVLVAFLGVAQKADAKELQKHSEALASIVAWLQKYLWVLLPVLSGLLLAGKALREFIGAPWVKDSIHSVLGVISEVVFAGEDNPDSAYDRVTLFRRKRFHLCWRRWPWQGWMVPVIRSGHTSQRMKTLFRAPDRPDEAEGVAGYCWANQKQVDMNGLPLLTKASSPADFESYSDGTHVSVQWLRSQLPQARAYFAFPIKAKGLPWGAVVIDSRSRIIGSRMKSITSIVGTILSELVERSGR